MKINCISCGHQIEIDDESYAHYHGPLRCWVCRAVLTIDIHDGRLESVALPAAPLPATGAVAANPLAQELSHD